MTDSSELDPLAALRDANPVALDRIPAAQVSAVHARVQGHVDERITAERPAARSWRRVGIAAGLVTSSGALVLAVAFAQGPSAETNGAATASDSPFRSASEGPVASGASATVAPDSREPGGAASCAFPYDLATLAERSWAFDGTVVAIVGNQVEFDVVTWYRGSAAPSVTLTVFGGSGTGVTSEYGPLLEVGGRYLVSGEEHWLWGCGFTRPYDEATATLWDGAMRR